MIKRKIEAWFVRGILEAIIEKKMNLRTRIVLKEVEKMLKGSWRTTANGIASILAGLGGLGTALTLVIHGGVDITDEKFLVGVMASLGLISSGWGLIMARDNKVSSEQAGANTSIPPAIKVLVLFGLLAVLGPRPAYAFSMIEASGNVIGTFKQPVRFTFGKAAAIGYARTSQKSSTDNRLIGLLPIASWGVLNVNLVGATPDFSDLRNQQELLGVAGGVRAQRVLAAAFPATAPIFVGKLPFQVLGQDVYYETELGALAGYDFTKGEAVTGYYVGPQLSLELP